jgi:hypothetical protein
MLGMRTFAGDKLFGLIDIGCRILEGSRAKGRERESLNSKKLTTPGLIIQQYTLLFTNQQAIPARNAKDAHLQVC